MERGGVDSGSAASPGDVRGRGGDPLARGRLGHGGRVSPRHLLGAFWPLNRDFSPLFRGGGGRAAAAAPLSIERRRGRRRVVDDSDRGNLADAAECWARSRCCHASR